LFVCFTPATVAPVLTSQCNLQDFAYYLGDPAFGYDLTQYGINASVEFDFDKETPPPVCGGILKKADPNNVLYRSCCSNESLAALQVYGHQVKTALDTAVSALEVIVQNASDAIKAFKQQIGAEAGAAAGQINEIFDIVLDYLQTLPKDFDQCFDSIRGYYGGVLCSLCRVDLVDFVQISNTSDGGRTVVWTFNPSTCSFLYKGCSPIFQHLVEFVKKITDKAKSLGATNGDLGFNVANPCQNFTGSNNKFSDDSTGCKTLMCSYSVGGLDSGRLNTFFDQGITNAFQKREVSSDSTYNKAGQVLHESFTKISKTLAKKNLLKRQQAAYVVNSNVYSSSSDAAPGAQSSGLEGDLGYSSSNIVQISMALIALVSMLVFLF